MVPDFFQYHAYIVFYFRKLSEQERFWNNVSKIDVQHLVESKKKRKEDSAQILPPMHDTFMGVLNHIM
jgi:hypothetical protein